MTAQKMIEKYEQDTLSPLTRLADPMCPNCGDVLESDDCYDTDIADTWVEHLHYGHCPSCEKEYQWKMVFVFAGYSDLREEK